MVQIFSKLIKTSLDRLNWRSKFLFEMNLHKKLLKENLMAQIFKDSIIDVDWVKKRNFSPSGAAANYSFLYILFRILNDFCPNSIIEFGIGQTSKLTSQYVVNKNSKAKLCLVENNKIWLDIFKHEILDCENIEIWNLKTEDICFNKQQTIVYKDLNNKVGNKRFDLIINDGPCGSDRYSRIGILDLIEKNLSNSFVIIIDDYDRYGEQETAKEVLNKLDFCKLKYEYTVYNGIKSQLVIYSTNLNFLKCL